MNEELNSTIQALQPKGIVQLIENLPKPTLPDQEDLKKRYFEDKKFSKV